MFIFARKEICRKRDYKVEKNIREKYKLREEKLRLEYNKQKEVKKLVEKYATDSLLLNHKNEAMFWGEEE